jgi:hypothetical protein
MDPPFASLALATFGHDAPLLVSATDASRLCRGGAYQMIPVHQVPGCLECLGRREMGHAREFAARLRLSGGHLSSLRDHELLSLLRNAIKARTLAVVRRCATSLATDLTVELRRLIAQIERRTRQRLSHAGRTFKLVADVDLGRVPSRGSYEVVRRDEAVRILAAIAEQSEKVESRELLAKARDKLTRDWRPPLQPDGLILLRRNVEVTAKPVSWEPPLTPSQYLKLLRPKTWIELEVVYEDGTTYAGPCVVSQSDGSTSENCLDNEGSWGKYEIDPGSYSFAIPPRPAAPDDEKAEEEETSNPEARRVRLSGMLFDANKCFLLPQALPGIKAIIAMHEEEPGSEVLIVGHAGGDEDLAGADIAYERAQVVGAYLRSEPDVWLNGFAPDRNPRSRWGTREIQLMLSALPEGGPFFYQGYASGVTDERTTAAIRAFQKHAGLPNHGEADIGTRKALVAAYMGLEDTTLGQDITPVAHGCEGHFDDTQTADGAAPDDRRLDVFFFPEGIAPAPAQTTSSSGDTHYQDWLEKLVETRDFEHHGIHVQIVDAEKQPVAFASAVLRGPITAEATADEHGFVSFFGLQPGEYTLKSEKNGYCIGVATLTYPTSRTVPGYTRRAAA